MLKSIGVGHLRPKFRGIPLGAECRPVMLGLQPKSEHSRLTNGEIIFEEFQPMWSQFTNVTDRQTDGQTDRQTTCDRNTALCTKVHRAVKSKTCFYVCGFKCCLCVFVCYIFRLDVYSTCISWTVNLRAGRWDKSPDVWKANDDKGKGDSELSHTMAVSIHRATEICM